MTDKEFIENIDKIGADELFDTLEYIGCDGYYRDVWWAIIEELKKRVVSTPGEERPKGEWARDKDGYWVCSVCGAIGASCYASEPPDRYCHECGAEMRDTSIKGKCINCSYKTDTCQEGLHCPRD